MLAQFGNYLLDEEIARGGMARVYRARLRGLGGFEKTLVVKQVLPELANDPRFVEMFVEEAKTLVQMSHPHVVPVYELGVIDGVYFLAMEHVDGATLADILRDGPLTPALAAHVGVQVCDALDYAHRRFGLVHRDVTPRNIIVDPIGHVRLLDFGIAAPADDDDDSGVFGSPGYMSPEQARGETIGPGSDLFSLGAVLFEALTGERAFLRASTEQSRAALLDEPPPRLEGRDGVPVELAEIVDRALSHDAAQRPESAARMGKALRGWIAASHPEGVGPELGDRAEEAREHARQRRSGPGEPPPDTQSGTPSKVVRTLATSPALEAMLEGEPEASDAGEASDAHRQDEPGSAPATAPLERPSRPAASGDDAAPAEAASEEPRTLPVEGRRSRPAAPAEPRADERAPSEERRPDAGGGRGRLALWGTLGALAIAVLVGVLVPRGGDDPPIAQGDDEPTSDTRASEDPSGEGGDPSAARSNDGDGPGPGRDPDEPPGADTDAGGPTADGPARAEGVDEAGSDDPTASERPADKPARLTVSAVPWANVRLDGRPTSPKRAPLRGIRIPPGSHRLELSCPPLGTKGSVSFEAEPGGHVRVRADLNSDPPQITVR